MWAYYAAITFLGVALGISQPAVQSFLPFLVTLDRLPQAIAWNATAYRTATIARARGRAASSTRSVRR